MPIYHSLFLIDTTANYYNFDDTDTSEEQGVLSLQVMKTPVHFLVTLDTIPPLALKSPQSLK